MKDTFWLEKPLILFKKNKITQLWPFRNLSTVEKLNALTRLIILLSILGFIMTKKFSILCIAAILIFGIIIIHKKKQVKNREAFISSDKGDFFRLKAGQYTQPTKQNPLMNVLLTDIADHPKRPPAAPAYEPPIEKEINNSTMDPRLFLDLGDNLQFDRSMRNFYAMPNTKVCSDQKAFGEFCYGNMPSCKEGNEFQCTKNNAGMRPY